MSRARPARPTSRLRRAPTTTSRGKQDAFVAKLGAGGSNLTYSSLLGGGDDDGAYGIAVDAAGGAYVTGFTDSANFPTVHAAQGSYGGGRSDAFVAKLDTTTPGAAALVYGSYLGGGDYDESDAIALDGAGNAYMTGFTRSTDFPTINAAQGAYGDGIYDTFVAKAGNAPIVAPSATPLATATATPRLTATGSATAVPATATGSATAIAAPGTRTVTVVSATATRATTAVPATATRTATATPITLAVPPGGATAPPAATQPGAPVPPSTPAASVAIPPAATNTAARGNSVSPAPRALPRITLRPTTARPGTIVMVRGTGFSRHEQVVLSLNGAALSTTPAIITTADGAFTATFAAPSSLLRGSNTVGAIGDDSRAAAVAVLNGVLPVAAQFYFAGGLNTADTRSTVALLNTDGRAAHVRLTFYFANGRTDSRMVTVASTARTSVAVAGLERATGAFGLAVTADRQITAQLNIARRGKDGDALLGDAGLATRWYLAEGYTGLTFHETIAILNPSSTAPAHVRLRLLPRGDAEGKEVVVTVPAHTNLVTSVDRLLPHRALSVVATSDRPVAVERSLTFGKGGYGLTTRGGINTAATSWLFAEGTTTNHFESFLTILNPGDTPARVTARFFGRSGDPLGSRNLRVAPRSRATIKLNDFLHASGIAIMATSSVPVVAERPEYFGSPNAARVAGSDVFGRNGASARWSFPGGDTAGNKEFLLLYNPSPVTVPVDVSVYGTAGRTMTRRVYIAPAVRYTIDVNRVFRGATGLHGATLRSVNGQGFVAEQTIFAPDRSALRGTEGLAR